MLLVKIIVISKEILMSLNDDIELMNYMLKEMVFAAFKKYGARELLQTKKFKEFKSDYQLVWVEKEKNEFEKFK